MSIFISNIKKNHNCILKELGITVWKLRYPIVLDYERPVKLWSHLKLLLISVDVSISLNDPFIKDVVRAMRINFREVCILTIYQIKTVVFPMGFSCHCWWIGTEVLIDFHGICLRTPSLSKLKRDIEAKCALWQQINRMIYCS